MSAKFFLHSRVHGDSNIPDALCVRAVRHSARQSQDFAGIARRETRAIARASILSVAVEADKGLRLVAESAMKSQRLAKRSGTQGISRADRRDLACIPLSQTPS